MEKAAAGSATGAAAGAAAAGNVAPVGAPRQPMKGQGPGQGSGGGSGEESALLAVWCPDVAEAEAVIAREAILAAKQVRGVRGAGRAWGFGWGREVQRGRGGARGRGRGHVPQADVAMYGAGAGALRRLVAFRHH